MPLKKDDIDLEIKQRFLSAMRYVIADLNRFGIAKRYEFANAIGWRPAALARCERTDDHYVPTKYLASIVKRFNVSAHWILTGKGEMFNDNINDSIEFEITPNPINTKVSVQTKNANKIEKSIKKSVLS